MINYTDIIRTDPNATLKACKKGTILQREGDLRTSAYFVNKGLLRSYIIDSKGKEHIYMFTPENWISADIEALEFKSPAHLFIDCLEDTEVLIFDKNCLSRANLSKDKIDENIQLLYRRIGKLQRRVLMLMGSPAIDRYHYFLESYPKMANRIPQKMIASYLGIAPQTLSTIRAFKSRKNSI